jgi:hypothetical protein
VVQGQPRQVFQETHLKLTRAKWTEEVAQAVQPLFCKHKAKFKPQSLSQKKKKKRQTNKKLPRINPVNKITAGILYSVITNDRHYAKWYYLLF